MSSRSASMSDRPPLNFKPAEAAGSVVARVLTPRTVIYLIALFGVMFFMRRYDAAIQQRPAASENNNAAALKLEPVARPATLGQPAERLPMLLVFDPGDSDGLPELIGALREQFAGRCNVTRVDVSKDPGLSRTSKSARCPPRCSMIATTARSPVMPRRFLKPTTCGVGWTRNSSPPPKTDSCQPTA